MLTCFCVFPCIFAHFSFTFWGRTGGGAQCPAGSEGANAGSAAALPRGTEENKTVGEELPAMHKAFCVRMDCAFVEALCDCMSVTL